MKKILIIEDDITLRESITDILILEGYDVKNAENGNIGVLTAIEWVPDLIICDINMPKMNGYEVYRNIQQNETTNIIPFIFLTAKAEKEDIRYGLRLGVDDYITKPFDFDELLTTIERRLNKMERLAKSYENKYKVFFENSITGIFTLKNDNLIFINPKFAYMLGYTPNELYNINFSSLVAEQDRNLLLKKIENCLQGIDNNIHANFNMIHKSGNLIEVQLFAGRSFFNNSNLLVGVIQEITKTILEKNNQEAETANNVEIKKETSYDITDFINLIEDNKTIKIILQGELSLPNTTKIQEKIIPLIEKYEVFEINLKNVNNIDLSCLQLLYALKITLEEHNKTLIFNNDIPEQIKMLIEVSDFYEVLSN